MESLTENDVRDYTKGICFKTGPPGRVGAELEWLVVDPQQPDEPVPLDLLRGLLTDAGALPAGGAVTFEPGGQLELSSLPQPGLAKAHTALAADIKHLDTHLGAAGLRLWGVGLDPQRNPHRQLTLQRYAAMEAYFDAGSPTGRAMMCSTASAQICLDIGADDDDARRRWRLIHALVPMLIAAFANSPLWRGRPTGWRCTRQIIWAGIDSSRTRPASGGSPPRDWADYALDARLMAIRRDDRPWIIDPGLRMRDWIAGGHDSQPSLDDLIYHLSTLFPPVRPRGWLELRVIDAPPLPWWPVPLAVASALIDDPAAAGTAAEAAGKLHAGTSADQLWLRASRDALTDPDLAECARLCFAAASDALPRMGAADLVPLVDAYREHYVARGRCPADDLLDPADQGSQ